MAAPRNIGLSRLIATLATRILRIPTIGYVDDFVLATPEELISAALGAFMECNSILGFKMQRGKYASGSSLVYLGLRADMPRRGPPDTLPVTRRESQA